MPSARFITGSHAERLAQDLSRKSRDVVLSDKYKQLFPEIELSDDQNTKTYFVNTKGGKRLHQNDATGMQLEKKAGEIRHICLPATDEDEIIPIECAKKYINHLFDQKLVPQSVCESEYKRLGEVGYAGQYRQKPVPRGGALFKVDRLLYDPHPPTKWKIKPIRYWDKAISITDGSAWTVGVKAGIDTSDNVWILDVNRGRWEASAREAQLLSTAKVDTKQVVIWMEQEPAASGKESVENSTYRLALHGFFARPDKVTGDKVVRADTFSVAVNAGRVILVPAPWNHEFVEELRFFPNSRYKDQVDAVSGCWSKLSTRRLKVGAI